MAMAEISKGGILPLDQMSVLLMGLKLFLKASNEFTLLKNLQQNQTLCAYELLIGMRNLDILIVIVFYDLTCGFLQLIVTCLFWFGLGW